ncbi:phenylacetate--CoA ligase family protein [Aquincola tertiaricarbonis]|uniref:phenylacetate--CoA ligase family protein n=1 Tax=Aquincola tertiaricarbonis TaxID=391953 RepID=UPI000615362E|nr:AMP-binding protein [Aquincola tertiaricarbonis]
MKAAEHFDALETRDPAEREAALMAALPAHLAQAKAQSPAQALRLAGIDAASVTSREALARLPVLRKHELLALQQAHRQARPDALADGVAAGDPFAGFAAAGWNGLRLPRPAKRVFQSPGPLYEPQGRSSDSWRLARAMHAAGFRAGDLVHNSFSYHLTPAGAMMEEGALALGCTVFPGGVGNTELQLQAMAELRPHGYCGTPSFLKIALEKAAEQQLALPSLRKALVSGEAFPPSLRDWLHERGVAAFQCYATADLGLIAYETEAREGLVLDEEVIVEIVRPGTGDPVADGEVGEVVVTTFDADYPLIRFGTGDLSAVLPGPCPTGRTQTRIRGWMGRADQTTKVRGMFVHPSQVAEVLRRHPAVGRARLVVEGEMANDRMTLHAEVTEEGPSGPLAEQLAASVRDVTKLRADVQLVADGSLPNDGVVIEDKRSYR